MNNGDRLILIEDITDSDKNIFNKIFIGIKGINVKIQTTQNGKFLIES